MTPEHESPVVRRLATGALSLLLASAATLGGTWALAYWPRAYTASSHSFWSATQGPAWIYQREDRWGATKLTGQPVSAWALVANSNIAVRPPPGWSHMTPLPGN